MYFLQQKDNNVVRFKICIDGKSNTVTGCVKMTKECLTLVDFHIFSFKFFTAEKKYTVSAFPVIVCVTLFPCCCRGLGLVTSKAISGSFGLIVIQYFRLAAMENIRLPAIKHALHIKGVSF